MLIIITITIFFLFISILLIRVFIYTKGNAPLRSFSAALQNENDGNYGGALTNYEVALTEIKKTKYNKILRIKIIEKIKTLHTVI